MDVQQMPLKIVDEKSEQKSILREINNPIIRQTTKQLATFQINQFMNFVVRATMEITWS